MPSSLIRGKYVVSRVIDDDKSEIIEDGAVYQEDGQIIEVGRYGDLKVRYEPDEVIGSSRFVVIPGMTNAHHHMGLTPLQLGSLDMPLEPGIFAEWSSREVDPYLDTIWCALQMIESGITNVMHNQAMVRTPSGLDFYESNARIIDAYEDSGMRVAFSLYNRDQHFFTSQDDNVFLNGLPPELGARAREGMRARPILLDDHLSASEMLIANKVSDRTRIFISPHNVHWCSDDYLMAIKEFATRHSTGLHVHLQETLYQRLYGDEHWGKTPLAHLKDLGFLGPELSCAHGVWLTDSDIDILAESGSSICHNPSSNLRLNSGIAPVNRLLEKGVNVAIGIDEAGINDDNDILQEMRLTQKIHREPGVGVKSPSSHRILDMATQSGADVTFFGSETGTLEPGKRADMVLLDLDRISEPYLDPDTNVVDAVVYRGRGSDVDTVIVDGEVLLQDGIHTKIDRAEIARQIADSLAGPLPAAAESRAQLNADLKPYVERWFASQKLPAGPTHYRYNAR
ncbi:MAG: amidohydrolase family protein [Chloroflexi bacterium]|jgi:5-methylthioadenosine/S-adenosylhomocysteine deaminase|nr:amidohydrolase family protein [Chloroflexota bacterium]MBT4074351.1 amidohydrolase family protein [Chloroflexota bacterium]MBT4514694.1 amidohydrolase family protein [Chloroflexota bacterium]MBT6681682.1 amidohydrolase family protein [Chloroflexota bacterium]